MIPVSQIEAHAEYRSILARSCALIIRRGMTPLKPEDFDAGARSDIETGSRRDQSNRSKKGE